MCETPHSITLYIGKFNLLPMVLSRVDSGVPSGVLHELFMLCCSLQCETTRAFLHSLEAGFHTEGLTGQRACSEGASRRGLEEREKHIQHCLGLKWMVSEWHSISCT